MTLTPEEEAGGTTRDILDQAALFGPDVLEAAGAVTRQSRSLRHLRRLNATRGTNRRTLLKKQVGIGAQSPFVSTDISERGRNPVQN